jgi:hypothetical protein
MNGMIVEVPLHSRAMRRAILMLCLIGLVGCSNRQLETGYTYTPLGDSPNKRRGYYADPFSPEARLAQQERTTDRESRRQVPGQ